MVKFNRIHARQCRAMRRRQLPLETIVNHFGGFYSVADIDWLIVELRRRDKEYAKKTYFPRIKKSYEPPSIIPPPEVIEQQQHRLMLWPQTITAWICGDPLPGESALDRRNG